MMALEDLFIKVARAGNILFFFFALFAAFKLSSGMPGDWRFLIIAGTAISAGMACGSLALFFRMGDRLDAQEAQLKSLLSASRESAGALVNINSIAKRVTAPRARSVKEGSPQ